MSFLARYVLLRWPGRFDAEWYLQTYDDVAVAGVNPLLHYIEHGRQEGRSPAPSHGPHVRRKRSGYRSARKRRRENEHPSNTGYCVICEIDAVFTDGLPFAGWLPV